MRMNNDEQPAKYDAAKEGRPSRPAAAVAAFALWPSALIAKRRSGITILEVLISIFVLSIGILSLASLIPVSQKQITDAARIDRGSAVGRAAFRDMQVRGYLNPAVWAYYDPTVAATAPQPKLVANSGPSGGFILPYALNGANQVVAPPFVIDPLGLSYPVNISPNGTYPPALEPENWRFPYGRVLNGSYPNTVGPNTTAPLLWRFTIDATPGVAAVNLTDPPMPFSLAERVFRATDELVFNQPVDATMRPIMNFTRSTVNPSVPIQASYDGNLSWFATVAPSVHEMVNNTNRNDLGPRQFTVSVVVVQNRDLLANTNAPVIGVVPAERMLLADIVSGGRTGGEIILRFETGATDKRSWLDCKVGDWIMLSSYVTDPTMPYISGVQVDYLPDAATGIVGPQNLVLAWYRIRAVDGTDLSNDANPLATQRNITLEGPDWELFANNVALTNRFIDAEVTAPVNYPTAYATLVTGAVAVYQKTMRFDGRSQFSP